MTAPTATETLAVLVDEHANALHELAEKLRAYRPSNGLPEHRVLQLSGDLIAQLGDLEVAVHHLSGWLEP